MSSNVLTPSCPYRGLAPFRPADAGAFFGRAPLVELLVSRLAVHPRLVVSGPTGCGKSSLLQAGLVPALANPAERTVIVTPGEHPLDALWEGLGEIAGAPLPDIFSLEEAPGAAAARRVGPGVLVVDQLEDLFGFCRDAAERRAFFGVLEALPPALKVVLGIRVGSYGDCVTHPWLVSAINANHVLIGPPAGAGLREAVEGPARRAGLRLEEGLADRVLADAGVADDPIVMAAISHALAETWRRREGRILTIVGYEASGGVAGAIEATAEAVCSGLDAGERRLVQSLLLRLGRQDGRSSLDGFGENEKRVLAMLSDAGLVDVDDRSARLASEVIIPRWPRLQDWLEEDLDRNYARKRLEAAAQEWESRGRTDELLLRGAPLAAALLWRDGGGSVDSTGLLARFLEAGEATRAAAVKAGSARDKRQREAHRRTVKLLVMALVPALVLVAILGFFLVRALY